MIDENKESILRRIQKLLAIAGDDRADPNEAAAAAGHPRLDVRLQRRRLGLQGWCNRACPAEYDGRPARPRPQGVGRVCAMRVEMFTLMTTKELK